MTTSQQYIGGFSTKRLAACMAAALGLGGVCVQASATDRVVTSCQDSYNPLHPQATWLRQQVAAASSGDTIDMTNITCSLITLANGAIPVTVANLEIDGPAGHTLTIDGNQQDRVFNHTGNGTFALDNLTITLGKTTGNGGCIQSAGTVNLFENVTISECSASVAGGGIAAQYVRASRSTISSNTGGGIYAAAYAYIQDSTISGNTGGAGLAGNSAGDFVIATSMIENNNSPTCGGIDATLNQNGVPTSVVNVSYSSVVGNLGDTAGFYGTGGICSGSVYLDTSEVSGNVGTTGGIRTARVLVAQGNDFYAANSTIANNIGHPDFTGIGVSSSGWGGVRSFKALIENSTISGNTGGGIYLGGTYNSTFVNSTISGNVVGGGINAKGASLFNSTVAFNSCNYPHMSGGITGGVVSLTSTIVANNSGDNNGIYTESDIYVPVSADLHASSSLIMASSVPNTSITADPQLLPLANNGGPVQTHALHLTSPALGVGSNPKNLTTDERGTGFPRTWANGQTDIGAFQTVDEIFKNGFEPQ